MYSEVFSTFSGKTLYGYTSLVLATMMIGVLSFTVWLHHFFTMGQSANINAVFGIATMSLYRVTVPARRTRHVRFNELREPEPVPRGTEYSSVIESDVPIVVQHTRLDSRQAENALMTTIAFPAD